MYNLLWNLSMNKWKQFTLTHYIPKQLFLSCSVKQAMPIKDLLNIYDMFLTKQEGVKKSRSLG